MLPGSSRRMWGGHEIQICFVLFFDFVVRAEIPLQNFLVHGKIPQPVSLWSNTLKECFVWGLG